MRIAVLAVLVAACGDAPDPSDTAISGKRLKLARWEVENGPTVWATLPENPAVPDLLDVDFGVACTPVTWGDGKTRCTPDLGIVSYLDAACTRPVLVINVPFAAERSPTCSVVPIEPVFIPAGDPMSVDTLFLHDEGACEAAVGGPFMVVTAGALPSSIFVGLTTTLVGDGPLALETLRGDDGLLVPIRPFDTRNGMPCDLADIGDGDAVPCIPAGSPSEVAPELVFLDETCERPAIRTGSSCPPPKFGAIPTFSCPRVFHLASEPIASPIFESFFQTCTASPDGEGEAFPFGARIDPLTMTRGPEISDRAVRSIYLEHGAMRFRDSARLFDTDLGVECELEAVPDDSTAECTPRADRAAIQEVFSDPACTEPITLIVETIDRCVERAAPTVVLELAVLLDPFRKVGPRFEGDAFARAGASCLRIDAPVYELGAPVVTFPTAVKRRDP